MTGVQTCALPICDDAEILQCPQRAHGFGPGDGEGAALPPADFRHGQQALRRRVVEGGNAAGIEDEQDRPALRQQSQHAAPEYLGIGETAFRRLVGEGIFPKPRKILGRTLWDADELRAAWRGLPRDGEPEHASSGSDWGAPEA